MKRVTNTWKEPIVLPLFRPPNQRTHQNLLVGEYTDIEDEEVSPEMELMRKKKKLAIVETPCTECGSEAVKAGKHDHAPSMKEDLPVPVVKEEEDFGLEEEQLVDDEPATEG